MKQPLEVWGGAECTVNRVGDAWYNQLALSGHGARLGDLDLIAELGIRTIRFPLLWELNVDAAGRPQWEWADRWLGRVRELGIKPIIGLVHHGSGPGFTNLLDEEFAPRLADFAFEVATRFPWVTDYTPINEPLTTARFSALYGLWYPHRRDDNSFCRALLNQCRGIVLAMEAIRKFNPGARLIQTEDLGTTYSTERLAYQKNFDNQRRWLTWDLLSGRVNHQHALSGFFLRSCCTRQELDWFVQNPCPPDVIGINHYVTSDRFLDERAERYPGEAAGSNSIDDYVDVPAVRVLPGGYPGWQVLEAAWHRYGTPLALTEVHLGCTREEQLRWFQDAWTAATTAQRRGCQIIAVTSWALFGSYNWNQLLTRATGHYEPGAFDCRSSVPRPTAVAHMLRRLCSRLDGVHPSTRSRGWWQRSSKLTYPLDELATPRAEAIAADGAPVILMVGGESPLGRALARACARRHLLLKMLAQSTPWDSGATQLQPLLPHGRSWAIIDVRAGLARFADDEALNCTSVAALTNLSLIPPSLIRSSSEGFGDRLHGRLESIDIRLVGEAMPSPSSATWGQLADASLDLLIDEAHGTYLFAVDEDVLQELHQSQDSLRCWGKRQGYWETIGNGSARTRELQDLR